MSRGRSKSSIQSRVGAVATFIFGFLLPLAVSAQLAPVSGAHYAAGASGMTGANGGGGFSASVPLDFSPADASVPIPVSVIYNGGKRMGVAGLGWDVPLSYIYHDASTAHRRPEGATQGHERWTLNLLGESINLVVKSTTPRMVWVAERGHPQLEVQAQKDPNSLIVYDGDGRTFGFDGRDLTVNDGTRLANGNLWLLTAIAAPGNRKISMDYAFAHPTLPGGGTGLSIDLNEVFYNYAGTGAVYKSRALLRYNASATPLAITMLGTTPLVRMNTLSFIAVNSTAGSSEKRVRTYNFDYTDQTTHQPKPDPDTGLPRLHGVTMTGQEGTTEAGINLPIASYEYGSVVDPNSRKITYQKSQTFAPPLSFGIDGGAILSVAYTAAAPSSEPHGSGDVLTDLTTQQNLFDLSGDGRPDYFQNITDGHLFHNVLDASGGITLSTAITGNMFDVSNKIHSASLGSGSATIEKTTNINDTLRQVIDINGDGRLDIVETVLPDTDHWILHLNTPDPLNPNNIVWVDVTVPVSGMRAGLGTTGLSFGRVPMKRVTTVKESAQHCWHWPSGGPQWTEVPFSSTTCSPSLQTPSLAVTHSITEFELIDVNGDGYPDFVFNGSFVQEAGDKPPLNPTNRNQEQFLFSDVPGEMTGKRSVNVMLNIAGAHLQNGTNLFAAPVTIEADSPNGCGVERWEPVADATNSGNTMNQVCGLRDVNGDGIVDRITNSSQVALGTGDMNQAFSTAASIVLPGPLARTEAANRKRSDGTILLGKTCDDPVFGPITNKEGHLSGALIDINGDGIPDYVAGTNVFSSPNWTVAMGTGTGFATPVSIVTPPGFELSYTKQDCPAEPGGRPDISATIAGMYDLDGDGQPDVVSLTSPDLPLRWDVYQLQRSNPLPFPAFTGQNLGGIPEAGHLNQVNNGYGASTRISYKSAKTDGSTLHRIPSPEIVATAVGTTDPSGNNFLTGVTQYAYGNVSLYFDALADAFVSTGYGRSVELIHTVDGMLAAGKATITDRSGASATGSPDGDFNQHLLVGTVGSVTTLSDNSLGTDPWPFLAADVVADTRRTSGAFYSYGTHVLPPGVKPANNSVCVAANPYTPNAAVATDDMCIKHGFFFTQIAVAYEGTPGSSSPVATASAVVTDTEVSPSDVDDFGRVRLVSNFNDLKDDTDDVCVHTDFANPSSDSDRPRVLNRPAKRIAYVPGVNTATHNNSCTIITPTLSQDTWEYDTQPQGTVTTGFVTAHTMSRLDEKGNPKTDANGNSDIRVFDAVVSAHGNTTKVTTTRDDGATRVVKTTFDPDFDLVPMSTTITATNADGTTVPKQTSSVTRDPLTFNVTSTKDANQQQTGTTFDGFSRVLTSTVTPTTGAAGILSSIAYTGFGATETGGRQVAQKIFTEPLADPTKVAATPGRTGTTFLDSLGRTQYTQVNLGPDYDNQTLIVGQRTYDLQGRVHFAADPFLFVSNQSFTTAYGTTSYFNAVGTPACMVRGPGVQPQTSATNEAGEIYPTCYSTAYANNLRVVAVQDASGLLANSPQAGAHFSQYTAIGRRVESDFVKFPEQKRQEYKTFGYDSFGRMIAMSRYQNADTGTNAIVTKWHYDSLGQVVELEEPLPNVPQFRSYDTWGELTGAGWCDPANGTCPTTATADTINRRSTVKYDALGRTTHREDQNIVSVNGQPATAQTIPETINDYVYDTKFNNAKPSVAATNVLGRLTKATSPTSSVTLSYDPYGRINSQVFTDLTATSGNVYVEKDDYHADGSVATLHLLLPDSTKFADEHVDYSYDSAGRASSATFTNGGTTQSLFAESGGIDVFGRLRHVAYAAATFDATYAENGRRLIADVKVTTPTGKSRETSFAPVAGIPGNAPAATTAFDPLGRERVRSEFINGTANPVKVNAYDALGRLATNSVFASGALTNNLGFGYDALGNMLQQTGPNPGRPDGPQVQISYLSTDRDRICGFGFGGGGAPSEGHCQVVYDAVGNITNMPTKFNNARTLTYEPNGQVRTISNGFSTATFDYDAFGGLQRMVLDSSTPGFTEFPQNIRHDKHFGGLIERRDENGISTVTRSFAIPGGLATQHGSNGSWTFTFGEGRGTRFATDQTGELVQDVDYKPYGETVCDPFATAADCPDPGTKNYTDEQWNGGDLLTATGFGVNLLGARVYDPVIGRFLSRDPIFDARNGFNPYAFAANDPINRSDPTGLVGLCANTTGWVGNCPGDGGDGENLGNNTDGQSGDGTIVVIGGGLVVVGIATADLIGEGLSAIGSALSCLVGCSHPDNPHTSTTSSSPSSSSSSRPSAYLGAGVDDAALYGAGASALFSAIGSGLDWIANTVTDAIVDPISNFTSDSVNSHFITPRTLETHESIITPSDVSDEIRPAVKGLVVVGMQEVLFEVPGAAIGGEFSAAAADGAAVDAAGAAGAVDTGVTSTSATTTLQANRAAGDAWEQVVGQELRQTHEVVAPQVTIRTPSGVRTRVDFVTRDGTQIGCVECKASATAPLTPNQTAAFPEIEQVGGVVVGKGKPGIPGGTVIPPTRVQIRRP